MNWIASKVPLCTYNFKIPTLPQWLTKPRVKSAKQHLASFNQKMLTGIFKIVLNCDWMKATSIVEHFLIGTIIWVVYLILTVLLYLLQIPDDDNTPDFGSSQQRIYGKGSLVNGTYILISECVEMTRSTTFLEAVCLLFSFYYTLNILYPPKAINTLKFLQNSVLKIYGGSIPQKVKTIV